jgi:hypothetical protein
VDCHLFELLVQRYYDGELDPVAVSDYEQHRRSCKVCRKLDAEYAELFGILENIPRFEPSPSFNAGVMARVDVSRYRVGAGRRAVGILGGAWGFLPAPLRIGSVIAVVFAFFVTTYGPLLDMLVGALRGTAALVGSIMVFARELPGVGKHLLAYFSEVENYRLAGVTILKTFQRIASELHITYILMAVVAVVLLLCIVRIARVASRKGETHAGIF